MMAANSPPVTCPPQTETLQPPQTETLQPPQTETLQPPQTETESETLPTRNPEESSETKCPSQDWTLYPEPVVKCEKLGGYEFWRQTLNSPRLMVAPMVDASELAWRMLSRRYGAQLCYTPMLHATVFVKDARYRSENLQSCPEDRPLIVQFCANDPDIFCRAAQLAAPFCDGIDLNLGCPQAIARRGNYGAFLQDEWDLIFRMIRKCHEKVPVPITAKIRVFEDVDKSVSYARMLEKAGCQILTVHGRTRNQKGMQTGLASWGHIKAVKEALKIPVFANGNIQFLEDAERCMSETGVDGIMSAEGNLHNPAIFQGIDPPIWQMAREYLQLVRKYPCPLSYARGHLFKLFQHFMPRNTDIREHLCSAHNFETLEKVTEMVKERCEKAEMENDNIYSSGIVDDLKLPFWLCQPYERPKVKDDSEPTVKKRPVEPEEDVIIDGVKMSKNKLKKLKRNPNKKFENPTPSSGYSICKNCPNPRGLKCENELCRSCCKSKSYRECLDCLTHNLLFKSKKAKAAAFKAAKTGSEKSNVK